MAVVLVQACVLGYLVKKKLRLCEQYSPPYLGVLEGMPLMLVQACVLGYLVKMKLRLYEQYSLTYLGVFEGMLLMLETWYCYSMHRPLYLLFPSYFVLHHNHNGAIAR
jgi:hypothetical protein